MVAAAGIADENGDCEERDSSTYAACTEHARITW